MSRFYVTTPIYYVNDRPHIGHAYTTVLADVLARYRKSMGDETFFLTGVDEHGQKVQDAAEKRGVSPQAHCDEMQAHFRDLWPTLGVQNDDFIRTTEDRHKRVVQHALQTLFDKGDIYEKEYEGWYSASVERYWTEKDLVDGKCPESGSEVTFLSERNYFFKMSSYKEALLAHIHGNPDFIRPMNRRNEVLGFLEKDLRDLCISRPKSRLAWGIELPFDTDFVTYVWFDALLNYATGIGAYADEERFEAWWPGATHLLGKDILTTHCIYWPTFLLALGLPLPQSFIIHGWWLMGDAKMSKSVGNVVDPLSLKEKYGPEVLRYFLMRDMSLGQDASFSEALFITRNNGDLANDLGNLLSRSTKLLRKDVFGLVVPEPGPVLAEDEALVAGFSSLPARVAERIDRLELNKAIDDIMAEVRGLNKYINATRPFQVLKEDLPRAGAILYNVLEGLRFAGTLLHPVMPEKCERILREVGWDGPVQGLSELEWGALKAGNPVTAGPALFARLEMPKEDVPAPAKPDQKTKEKEAAMAEEYLSFEDFLKVKMVVGHVLTAEKVAKSDKLLRIEVDLGNEKRQVVSGIAKYYAPEDLVGTRIVVLTNLKPRKIFGLESQGMILAAEAADGTLKVITTDGDMAPGAEVS